MRDADNAVFEYLVDGKSNHTAGEELGELAHKTCSMAAAVKATMQRYNTDKQLKQTALNQPSLLFSEAETQSYDQARKAMEEAIEKRFSKTWDAFLKEGKYRPSVRKQFGNLENFYGQPFEEIKVHTAGATSSEKTAVAQAEELNYLKSMKEGLSGTETKNLSALQYMSENRLAKNHTQYAGVAQDKAFCHASKALVKSGEREILPGIYTMLGKNPLKSLCPTIKAGAGAMAFNALLDHQYFDDRHTDMVSTTMDAIAPFILATGASPRVKFLVMVGSHCLGKLGAKRYCDLDKEQGEHAHEEWQKQKSAEESVARLGKPQSGNVR